MEDIFITREDLRDYIHDIHNYIRNNGCGYGQMGLKIFNVFYGLKLIKPHLKKLNLTHEQELYLDWDVLVKKSKENNEIIEYIDTKVLEELFNLKNDKYNKNHNLGKFLFYQIPKDLKDNVWKELIHKINILPVGFQKDRKVNLSGKVYEYFCSQDATAISEMGAYFTDRHITDFIFNNLLKIQIEDNKDIPSLIDPFGGSGGFTLGYANYLQNNFENINWKKNINNIYHFDMEETVINMTGLEMFAITGYFPKTTENYLRGNSFITEFNDLKSYIKEYPELTETLKEQLKELVKQTNKFKKQVEKQTVNLNNCSSRIKKIAKKYKIDIAKDKESCSLLLFMDLLTDKGTCVAVMKEGVFFDNKYSFLRSVLINNYNITDIISVPQSAFENTSTKTSIIKFIAGSKTKKINFSELIVDFEPEDIFEIKEDNKVHLIKNKGEIKNIKQQTICFATYENMAKPTIIKNRKGEEVERFDWSLNYKDYKNNTVFCPKGYELKKLGDICKILTSKINSGDIDNNGIFNFYSGCATNPIGKHSKYNFDFDNYIGLIKGGGSGYGKYGDNIGLGKVYHLTGKNAISNGMYILKILNDEYFNYIYMYLKKNKNMLMDLATYTTGLGNIKQENLKNTQIPIPKDITTIEKELTKLQKLHQQITEYSVSIPEKEKNICNLIKKLTDEGEEGNDYESKKLGDVCEIDKNIKKYETNYGQSIGKYNFHTGSEKNYLFCNDYNIEEGIVINKTNGSGICNIKYDKNFSVAKQTFVIKSKIIKYTYYYLKLHIKELEKGYNGACHKNLSSEFLINFTIKILKPSILSKYKIQELFDEVDKLKDTLEKTKITYQQKLNELFKDFKEDEEQKEEEEQEDKTYFTNCNSKKNLKDAESSKSETLKIIKINDKKCIKEGNNYYIYEKGKKGDLFAQKNKKGEINIIENEEEDEYEIIEVSGKDYILIDSDVYTIKNNKPNELYGNYTNGKFKKISKNDKIVVKGKKQEIDLENFETELNT
jgi:restriction endonuclease S subunit